MASNPDAPRRDYGCPECGKPVSRKNARGPEPVFCSDTDCKKSFFNRAKVDGAGIIALAKAWRLSRNNKADAELGARCLSAISAALDYMNERDREEGRTTARTLGYAETRLKSNGYKDNSEAIRWHQRQAAEQAEA